MLVKCPACGGAIQIDAVTPGDRVECPTCHKSFKTKPKAGVATPASASVPESREPHPRRSEPAPDRAQPAVATPVRAVAAVASPPVIHPVAGPGAGIPCGTCKVGTLSRRKKYRLSGPAVVIGYILLIPSVLGILVSAFICVMTPASVTATPAGMTDATRQRLIAARIPQVLIEKISNSEIISQADRLKLTPDQRRELDAAQLSLAAGKAGTALGGAFLGGGAICFGVASFIGGLLGWILIMKKRVLQCDQCGATVAAS